MCEKEGEEQYYSCATFFMGFADGVDVGLINGGTRLYCFPEEGTRKQGMQVAVKYMRAHPENLHEPAALSIVLAWKEAFPCAN